MPLFEYEPLILSPKLEILNVEEDKRDTNGARPLKTKVVEWSRDLKGRKDSPEREVVEQTLEQVEFVLQDLNSQDNASTTM